MPEAYTIRIFVPNGDPEGLRIIDRLDWTGCGFAFQRGNWPDLKGRPELAGPGVYVLVGASEKSADLPAVYIGQAGKLEIRIEQHYKQNDFWNWAVAFVTPQGQLNQAHTMWLEHALVQKARAAKRCILENSTSPNEPALSVQDRAYMRSFLREILQILPLLNLRVFEKPIAISVQSQAQQPPGTPDTIIVPAKKEGFKRVFLGESCWYAVRIAGGMLSKIRYIAAYQTSPTSAITHYAPVARIEPYGDEGKYRLVFSEPAKEIGPIPFGDAPSGSMQGPRYTTLEKLRAARSLRDLL